MVNVSQLRTLVNNGWTIANRRAVASQIGKNNFDEIARLARKAGMGGDVFEYQAASHNLTKDALKDTKSFLKELIEANKTQITPKWGRELNLAGTGQWNSQYYGEYRSLCVTGEEAVNSVTNKITQADMRKRELFAKCKELGCDEIQYRGESYHHSKPHYKYLLGLKKGDVYSPKATMWTSDTAEYAWGTYGGNSNPAFRNVHYEILCPEKTKIIQTSFSRVGSESVLSPEYSYKVVNSELKDNVLKLSLECLPS